MDLEEEIKESLNRFVNKKTANGAFVAKVTDVDKSNTTIDVVDSLDNEIFNVRLKATSSEDKNGFVVYPAIDSFVIVAPLAQSKNAFYVGATTEVESTVLYVDDKEKLTITKDQIHFDGNNGNEGNNGGLVKVVPLFDRIQKLENTLNSLLIHYKAHVHPDAVKMTVPIPISTIDPVITQDQIENSNITH